MIYGLIFFLLMMATILYKIGSRLYWQNKWFNYKTEFYEEFDRNMIGMKPSLFIKYHLYATKLESIDSKEKFYNHKKELDKVFNTLPTVIKKKRNKKIDELLK